MGILKNSSLKTPVPCVCMRNKETCRNSLLYGVVIEHLTEL